MNRVEELDYGFGRLRGVDKNWWILMFCLEGKKERKKEEKKTTKLRQLEDKDPM